MNSLPLRGGTSEPRVQASGWLVREDVYDLSPPNAGLHALPETHTVEVAVGRLEYLPQAGRQGEKAGELLGEDVARSNPEPGLVCQLVIVALGGRELPEIE